MSGRRLRPLAIGLYAATITLVLGRVGVRLMEHMAKTIIPDHVFRDAKLGVVLFTTSGIATLGVFLATRRSRNLIGWLFLFAALGAAVRDFSFAYSHFVLESKGYLVVTGTRVSLPAAPVVEWVSMWVQLIPYACVFVFALLLFPNGTLPSRRWRPVAALCAATVGVTLAALALTPWEIDDRTNPFAVRGLWYLEATLSIAGRQQLLVAVVLYGCTALAATALVIRYRRAGAEERRQIKWFAFAGAVATAWILTRLGLHYAGIEGPILLRVSELGGPLSTLLVAAAAAVAVFKYRLYEIDFIIRRTIVFGGLLTFIVAVYAVAVVAIGRTIGGRGSGVVSTVVAMGLVATGFEPVRLRTQRWANRVVFGERMPPDQVLRTLPRKMAAPLPVEEVLPGMAEAVARGVRAEVVRVSVALPGAVVRTAEWPRGGATDTASLSSRTVDVRYLDFDVGAIEVFKRRGDPVTRADDRLLRVLAAQAGAAMWNVRLAAELQARLDQTREQTKELAASQRRLLFAQVRTRRRLEDEIRNRIEPQLLALRSTVNRAKSMLSEGDGTTAAGTVATAGERTTKVLEDLRELARGLFPPLLVEKGSLAALEAQARKSRIRVAVEASEELQRLRLSQAAESAIYLCCAEAIRGIEYTATEAKILLTQCDDVIHFAVEAVGRADATIPSDVRRDLTDRVEALGGSLAYGAESTVVSGSVPVQVDVASRQASASR